MSKTFSVILIIGGALWLPSLVGAVILAMGAYFFGRAISKAKP